MYIFSLQSELDACKLSKEEEICSKLHQELEDLQEQHYRKKMKLQVQGQNSIQKPSLSYTEKAGFQKQVGQSPLSVETTIRKEDAPCVFEGDYESDISDEIWSTFEQLDCSMFEETQENFDGDDEVEALEATCRAYHTVNDPAVSCNTQHQRSVLEEAHGTFREGQKKAPVTIGVQSEEFSTGSSQRKRSIHSDFIQKNSKCKQHSNHEPIKSLFSKEKPRLPYLSTDSPCCISRKRPGESIYKAPGGVDMNSSKM